MKDKKVLVVDNFEVREIPNMYFLRFFVKYDDYKIAEFFSHFEKDLESGDIKAFSNEYEIYPIQLLLKDNLKNKFFSDLNIDLCSSDEREKAVEKFQRTVEIVDFLENFDFLELLEDLIEDDYK